MVRCPVGEAAVVVLWLSQWNRDGPRARSRHEQQVGVAGFVPEDTFAVDPGGVVAQDAEGGFDFGAAVAAVHAQGHRQGPGQRVEAAGPPANQRDAHARAPTRRYAGQGNRGLFKQASR